MPKHVKYGRPISDASPQDLLKRLNKPSKRLTIDLSPELHKRIKAACVEKGRKMIDEIRLMLEERFPAR